MKLGLSTFSAANMNGWQKAGSRKKATNVRNWVLADADRSSVYRAVVSASLVTPNLYGDK